MKKKLLFITSSFSLGGGAEKILSLLTRNLDEEKYEIDILEIENYGYIEKIGSHTKILPAMLNKKRDSKYIHFIKWQLLKFFPRLLRKSKTKRKKYDYEIAFNYLFPVFCLEKNSKSISWNHGSIYNLEHEHKRRIRLQKDLNHVNKIVAISDKTLDSLNYIYPEYSNKTILINNGYDFKELIENSNDAIPTSFEEDNLIFLGRIEKAKGVTRLLNIFKNILAHHPNKKLYLLGTGELDDYVKSYIKENNLHNNIIPLGYIKNPYPYIKKSAFIVMTSEAEGFPTVFVEGLALGVGFVSTDVGGVKELSNNGTCGFVSDNDNELTNYLIEELKKEKSTRIITKENCENHVSQYDISKQIEKFEKLLEEL